MSLAQAVESARLNVSTRNVLTLDIERLPGRARHQHRGLTIEGDFWDLSGWKHILGYRLPPESVIEWPRTICAAWQFYGGKRVEFASEWGDGREEMLRRIWDAYDQADVLYGHNVAGFDTKNLNSEWLMMGLNPPSPFKTLDTLKEARKTFGFESNTLASLTDRLGIETKTDKYSVAVARAAVAGSKKDQRAIKAYNVGDIHASRAFVDRLRGWIPSHPHNVVGTIDDRPTCNQCWGDNLERNGTRLAQLITYTLWRCSDCGANVQGSRHARAAITRGAA
jgi:ribosomal protein L37AE/L43A